MTKSRDQDLYIFFSGLYQNIKTRHFLLKHFEEDYDKVDQ